MALAKPSSRLAAARDAAVSRFEKENPTSKQLYESSLPYLPSGSSRSSIFYKPFPLYVKNGHGTVITDVDGHQLKDFQSDMTSGLYGKSNGIITQAITKALQDGLQLGAHTAIEGEFAKRLCDIIPSFESVRFTTNGTDANLFAICLAQRFIGKNKVVVFDGGFHGSIIHNWNARPGKVLSKNQPLSVPFDYLTCPYNDIEGTRKAVLAEAEEVGIIVVEPLQGHGGARPGNPDFLRSLRTLADEIGSLLIFDEVQSARLAWGGLQALYDIRPDLTTVGKFFGGGMPFGAFGGRKDILALFDSRTDGFLPHSGTWNNTGLTMVAGLTATRDILSEEKIIRVNDQGDKLRDALNDVFSNVNVPFQVVGKGSINHVHCTVKLSEDNMMLKELLFFSLLNRGVMIAPRGLISNNFSHTDEDIETLVSVFESLSKDMRALYP